MSIKPVNASGGSRIFCLPRRWPPPALPWTFVMPIVRASKVTQSANSDRYFLDEYRRKWTSRRYS